MYERPSKMDVFRKKTNKETKRKIAPEKTQAVVSPAIRKQWKGAYLSAFTRSVWGQSANSSERYVHKGQRAKTVHRYGKSLDSGATNAT